MVGLALAGSLAACPVARATSVGSLGTFSNVDYAWGAVGGIRQPFYVPTPGPLANTVWFATPNTAPGTAATIPVTFPLLVSSVKQAFLVWHGTLPPQYTTTAVPATGAATFAGQAITGTSLGAGGGNCWANPPFGNADGIGESPSQAFIADVTPLVQPLVAGNGGTISFPIVIGAPLAQGVNGASLLVFFDDGNTNNNWDINLFAGNDSTEPGSYDNAGWTDVLSGINYAGSTATLQLHVSDTQRSGPWPSTGPIVPNYHEVLDANGNLITDGHGHLLYQQVTPSQPRFFYTDPEVKIQNQTALTGLPQTLVTGGANFFNGDSITLGHDELAGGLWDVKDFSIGSFLIPGINQLGLNATEGPDCMSLVVALVKTPAVGGTTTPGGGTNPSGNGNPPPANLAPSINCSAPATLYTKNPTGLSFAASAVVSDPEGGALGVVLTVTSTSSGANSSYGYNIPAGAPNAPSTATFNLTLAPDDNYTLSFSVNDGKNTSICESQVSIRLDQINPYFVQPVGSLSCFVDQVVNADPISGLGTVPDVTTQVTAKDNYIIASLTQNPIAGVQIPLGTSSITVTATDGAGNQAVCTGSVLVRDVTPPVITTVPGPLTLSAGNGISVPMPNLLPSVSYTENCPGVVLLTQSTAPGTPLVPGTYTVVITAKDAAGNTSNRSVTIVVTSNGTPQPPTVTCGLGTGELWPPNHKLVDVGYRSAATGSGLTTTVKVYSNEDDVLPKTQDDDSRDDNNSKKDSKNNSKSTEKCWGSDRDASNRHIDDNEYENSERCDDDNVYACSNFSPDAKLSATGTLRLRAERVGIGSGRVYLIVTTTVDALGRKAFCLSTCGVPHDQSAASKRLLADMTAAAVAAYAGTGQPPAGYYEVGDGPVIGPKQ